MQPSVRFAGVSLALLLGSLPARGALAQEGDSLQVRAKEIILADGSRLADGLLVVEGGFVTRVGDDADVDASQPLIEHDGVLTAGLVACQTESGAAGETYDRTRSLLPEARLVHAFDPEHGDFERALAAGITTVVLTPSGQNVAGGLTAVVKTHGGRVLAREGHLALSFSSAALAQATSSQFFFFGAGEDGGLEDTESSQRGSRAPTSYSGALRALETVFADPDSPYGRAARGELPVLIEAWDRNEVQRAVRFASELGLKGALYGAPLAGDPGLVGLIARSGLGVVVGPYAIGQRRRSLETVRILHDAGIPVAFALDGPVRDPQEMRLSGAMALSAGAHAKAVWGSLTSEAARLAGVADRVGALERGKEADFVLWSGDPLNLSSRVEAVFVDGRRAYTAPETDAAKEVE